MTPSDPTPTLTLSTKDMQTFYSNFARGLMTAEEVILDFGVNPNAAGRIVEEPANISARVIFSIPSAARLHQLLGTMLSRYQQAAKASESPAQS